MAAHERADVQCFPMFNVCLAHPRTGKREVLFVTVALLLCVPFSSASAADVSCLRSAARNRSNRLQNAYQYPYEYSSYNTTYPYNNSYYGLPDDYGSFNTYPYSTTNPYTYTNGYEYPYTNGYSYPYDYGNNTQYYNNYGSPYTTSGQYICPQVVMTILPAGCGYDCSLDSSGCRRCTETCRNSARGSVCRCAQTFRPVCGKDDVTYINDCYADCANVDVRQTGVCH